MNKWPVTALLISWVPIGFSAEAILTGQGQVLSAPDYVELTILVDSKCYGSVDEARKINDTATRKIVDFLNDKLEKKDTYNAVTSYGGYTLPYQTYYQDKYFCQDTFQKQNTIVFRTQNIKQFEGLFEEIQNMVYKQFPRNAPAVVESAISYVTMSNPTPGISTALRTALEQKAIALALHDATAKLSALMGTNKIQNLKISHVSELPPDEIKPFFREMAPMAMASGRMEKSGNSAPVQFDEQNINKIIYFKFTFDDITLPASNGVR
jgi:uncharacterized protein YggE